MMDYLLKFDEENDAEYKNSMIGMLKNLDKSETNVLETYITKDIGKRPLKALFQVFNLQLKTWLRTSSITTSAVTAT